MVKGNSKNETKYKKIRDWKGFWCKLEYNGSITLEAAMVFPIFIFPILFFINFMTIFNFQNIMQSNVIEAAKSIGKYAYVINRMEEKNMDNMDGSSLGMDNSILLSGFNIGYLRKEILTKEIKYYSDKVNIYGGMNGISLIQSKFSEKEEGINDIRVCYKIVINYPVKTGYSFRLSNRCYFRSWIGTSIDEQNKTGNKEQIVFVTKTGDVYHLTDACTYIKLSLTKVMFGHISNLRNEYGAKYRACNKCAKKQLKKGDFVYITASGTKYHCDSTCSKIKRDVIPINLSEVVDKKPCSRCGRDK